MLVNVQPRQTSWDRDCSDPLLSTTGILGIELCKLSEKVPVFVTFSETDTIDSSDYDNANDSDSGCGEADCASNMPLHHNFNANSVRPQSSSGSLSPDESTRVRTPSGAHSDSYGTNHHTTNHSLMTDDDSLLSERISPPSSLLSSPKTRRLKLRKKYNKLKSFIGKNLSDVITMGKFGDPKNHFEDDDDVFAVAQKHARSQHKRDTMRVTVGGETSKMRECLGDEKMRTACEKAMRRAEFVSIERERTRETLSHANGKSFQYTVET